MAILQQPACHRGRQATHGAEAWQGSAPRAQASSLILLLLLQVLPMVVVVLLPLVLLLLLLLFTARRSC